MEKIKSLFERNYEGDRLVYNKVVKGCEWVLQGYGIPTRKFDGTCCMVKDGILYKRYEVKKGKKPPQDFIPACEIDKTTGKQQGWVNITKHDKYHLEAFNLGLSFMTELESEPKKIIDGTYELIGPKIQGNPERAERHILIRHGACILPFDPRNFEGIKMLLHDSNIEGIVWHSKDYGMAKIKKKDFFKRWMIL